MRDRSGSRGEVGNANLVYSGMCPLSRFVTSQSAADNLFGRTTACLNRFDSIEDHASTECDSARKEYASHPNIPVGMLIICLITCKL